MLIFEEGESKNNFYKIAFTKKAWMLINNEEIATKKIQSLNPASFIFPQTKKARRNILCIEDISQNGRRQNVFGAAHENALSEIYSKTRKFMVRESIPVMKDVILKLEKMEEVLDPRIPKRMVKKLRSLLNSIKENKITVSMCHGDFTSWNMFVHDNKLSIYDWELANPKMPVGYDAFHFIIQQGILVDRIPWKEIKRLIQDKITPEIFTLWSQQDEQQMQEYLRLYLLINTVTNLALFLEQPKWHTQVTWLLNTWDEAISDCLSSERSNRVLVITDIFDYLQSKRYAAIKFPNTDPAKLSVYSDIDLCMEKNDLAGMMKFLNNHPLIKHVHITRKSFMVSAHLFLNDNGFLSLDLIWKFKRKSIVMVNAQDVINNAYMNLYGVKQMIPSDLMRYTGLFYGLNNARIPEKYQDKESLILNGENSIDRILYTFHTDNTLDKTELIRRLKMEPDNKYRQRLINKIQYLHDTFKQIFFSKGMIITFSGVDGAGKSTVIDKVKHEIEKRMRKPVIVLRHRPSVLPILSAFKKGVAQAEKDAEDSLPRQGSNTSFLSSFLRFSYYYFDYLLGQFYVQFRYVRRGYIVLYDRYYFDFINDSRRSNIKLPKGLISAGYRFILKPGLNIFLYADASIIRKRKKELDEPTIRNLTNDYLRLFNGLNQPSANQYISIENIDLNQTVDLIVNNTKQNLARIS